MGRQSIAFDQAHNPTQLANELRAAGLDAQVSDKKPTSFGSTHRPKPAPQRSLQWWQLTCPRSLAT
jgi:hypothetical protein